MPITILFDLDDTLLYNPLESFMPAYIKLLSKALAPYISPEKMIPQLLKATDRMVEKNSPLNTLEQTFDENFYPILGVEKRNLIESINHFYESEFQTLKSVTKPVEGAKKIIDTALNHGHTIAIATNPLFPLKAMLTRLEWAGFSGYPFKLITSYETMHFAKPNPAYYQEIVGIIGLPQQPVVMVGNNLKDDIFPAERIGIPSFLISNGIITSPVPSFPLSDSGAFENILDWIQRVGRTQTQPRLTTPSANLAVLRSTPGILANLTQDLSIANWRQKPEASEWSLLEIVNHLMDVDEEINLPRMKKIMSEDNPFIAGIDSDIWAKERNYNENDPVEILRSFFVARTHLLKILDEVTEPGWNKTARHSIFGPTYLGELVNFIADHDLNHIDQIHKTIGRILKIAE
jgi:FMN phosphatase YigB (HAD superfamily)